MPKKCGDYATVGGAFYLIPRLGILERLRKVVDDHSVTEMGLLAMNYKTVDMYVLHQVDDPPLSL